MVEKSRPVTDVQWDSVQRAHNEGVLIPAGNDGGAPPSLQHDIATELELLVQSGLTTAEALAAATSGTTKVLGLAGEIGTVEPGKQADLVVVAGGPPADIGAIREVQMVIKAGRVAHRR